MKNKSYLGSYVEDISSCSDIDIAVSGIKQKDFFNFYGTERFQSYKMFVTGHNIGTL